MTRSRGFTLLEVLVAISILGLSLTAILSAQTGLFASLSFTEHTSIASGLVRCKMSELEIKMDKEGFPLMDAQDEGACCADEAPKAYRCKWKVEKVILPPPPTSNALSSTISSTASGLGPLAAIATMGQTNGSALGGGADLGKIGGFLAGGAQGGSLPGGLGALGGPFAGMGGAPSTSGETAAPGSAAGAPSGGAGSALNPLGTITGAGPPNAAAMLAPLVMTFVYPQLKPMLEASIRKVTVGVYWKEGTKERDLTLQQFVTNPVQGGLDPNAAKGLQGLGDALSGALPGGGGTIK